MALTHTINSKNSVGNLYIVNATVTPDGSTVYAATNTGSGTNYAASLYGLNKVTDVIIQAPTAYGLSVTFSNDGASFNVKSTTAYTPATAAGTINLTLFGK